MIPKTVLLVGGGSLGHIAPSIAVAQALKELHPEIDTHFVCLPSVQETAYISAHGFACSTIAAPRRGLAFLWRFPWSLVQAFRILHAQKPQAIFSKGGFASVPLCLAARIKGIPIVLHESDVVSGDANRLVARWAAHICYGFSFAHDSAFHAKSSVTGNPLRPHIAEGSRDRGLLLTGFSGKKPILLAMGGSQGAQALNDILLQQMDVLLAYCDVIHLTGKGKGNAGVARRGYWQRPFVTEDLPHLYACADIALSRAGEGSIGELAANGIPTILVPLRDVGHDHQYANAIEAAKSGGCIHLEQEALPDALLPTIEQILGNTDVYSTMRVRIAQLASPEASRQIAEIISEQLA